MKKYWKVALATALGVIIANLLTALIDTSRGWELKGTEAYSYMKFLLTVILCVCVAVALFRKPKDKKGE